jgi:flagellar biosynthesis/type III secretory pathway M-ring protein FliF/YscJ
MVRFWKSKKDRAAAPTQPTATQPARAQPVRTQSAPSQPAMARLVAKLEDGIRAAQVQRVTQMAAKRPDETLSVMRDWMVRKHD